MILDTNALSAFIDGEPAVGEVLRRQARVAIPVIVLGEFRYGISQSRHRKAYEDWLDANLRRFEVLAPEPICTVRLPPPKLLLSISPRRAVGAKATDAVSWM